MTTTDRDGHAWRAGSTTLAVVVALALALLVLTGCGSDNDAGGEVTEALEDLEEAQSDSGVPEECGAAFPMAWGEPDLDEADLPATWPEPPASAVLCAVSASGGAVRTIDYASSLDAASVLDHYEGALTALDGSEVSREEPPGLGHEIVTGSAGDLSFQVDPRSGGFRIAVSTE